MDKLIQSTLDSIKLGTDTHFGEGALKNTIKKDVPNDLGSKSKKQPKDGAGKAEPMKKL